MIYFDLEVSAKTNLILDFGAVVNVIGGWWELWSLALRPKLGILS